MDQTTSSSIIISQYGNESFHRSDCFLSSSDNNGTAVHSLEVVILMCVSAGICSFLTIAGNAVVILSFVINKNLRNFSNYLILSLAVSDFTIGAFSMNVFTTYTVNNSWTLGTVMCKAWLTVDYTASNASVMNLLVICFDRYLAITKPVKYRKWCTPRRAGFAIAGVWALSFLMWAPAIILWDVISASSQIRDKECYIPFLDNNAVITVATICIAFYFPALLMCALYRRVIYKLKKRRHGVRSLVQSTTSSMAAPESECFEPATDEHKLIRKSAAGRESLQRKSGNSERVATSRSSLKSIREASARSRRSTCNSLNGNHAQEKQVVLRRPAEWFNEANHQKTNGHQANGEKLSVTESMRGRRALSTSTDHKGTAEADVLQRSVSFSSSFRSREVSFRNAFKRGSSVSTRQSMRVVREKRVTVLLKFILMCFIILWLPYSLIVVVTAFCRSCVVPAYAWNVGYWLCYLNSTVNPFCYGLCNENFRRTFKAIMTTRWWTKDARKYLRTGRVAGKRNRSVSRDSSEIKKRITNLYRK
uniref:Muscarinic acetylcholine receptor M3-like n=1 Tax=Phallusia mammillata TaxID=59560 RepID=A0A6F9D8L0_9ASCI|nr:muscarinic acetylcholine receptor M3-like [Phallusia mammillata]